MSEERPLLARDIMVSDPVTVNPETTVYQIAKIMAEKDIGSVIVVENNKVVGIVTEEDLIRRVLAEGRDPNRTRAGDIMSRPVVYVSPDAEVKEVALLMARLGIGHIPVIDGNRLVGIIAEYDIIRLTPDLIELLYVKGKLGSPPVELE